IGILRAGSHLAVDTLSKGAGPAAPVVGAAGSYGVDYGFDKWSNAEHTKAQVANTKFDDDTDNAVLATVAQIAYRYPEYRAKALPLTDKYAALANPDGTLK